MEIGSSGSGSGVWSGIVGAGVAATAGAVINAGASATTGTATRAGASSIGGSEVGSTSGCSWYSYGQPMLRS